MQEKIRSRWDDIELLWLADKNQIFRCFELIGIHQCYLMDMNLSNGDVFEQYYIECVKKAVYGYRNKGVIFTYKLLKRDDGKLVTGYYISKKSLRHYGITYAGERVVLYEGTYVVLKTMLDYIKANEQLREVYYKHIHRNELDGYISFQKECFNRSYCGPRRRDCFGRILNDIENMIGGEV